MRLVFIHGINEDHKKPLALRRKWQRALHSAWDAAGLSRPHYKLEMPYYGGLAGRSGRAAHAPSGSRWACSHATSHFKDGAEDAP